MPARTVGQLSALLSSYTRAPGVNGPDFVGTLNQVLEKVYTWGLWRDITFEDELPIVEDRIALPWDAESLLYFTVDDFPGARVRPLWEDYKNVGRGQTLGVTDDGFHVGATDLDPEVDHVIVFTTAHGTDVFDGQETFTAVVTIADVRQTLTMVPTSGATFVASDADTPIQKIHSITWSRVSCPLVKVTLSNLTESDDSVDSWAWIAEPEGVLQTRRFRISGTNENTVLRALLKRKHVPVSRDSDIIHLGNSNALKHGFLAVLAEDMSDLEKAGEHWTECRRIYDEELGSSTDGQQQSLSIDLWGGQSPIQQFI